MIEMILTKLYGGIIFVYISLYIEEKIFKNENSIRIVRKRFEKVTILLGIMLLLLEIINKNFKISIIIIEIIVITFYRLDQIKNKKVNTR